MSDPIIILSAFKKSCQAYPSLKNSGLEHKLIFLFLIIILFKILFIVPGGVVDFITIIIFSFLYLLHISLIIFFISLKSTSPFFFSGVPTQIKILFIKLFFIFKLVSKIIFFFFITFF